MLIDSELTMKAGEVPEGVSLKNVNNFMQETAHFNPPDAVRHRLPKDRRGINHKFKIGEHKFYVIVGLYPGGKPGELFIHTVGQGSTMSGLLDSLAITLSMALQHGVPLKSICDKLKAQRFEPAGPTGNPEFGIALSVVDYVFRWLEKRFVLKET